MFLLCIRPRLYKRDLYTPRNEVGVGYLFLANISATNDLIEKKTFFNLVKEMHH